MLMGGNNRSFEQNLQENTLSFFATPNPKFVSLQWMLLASCMQKIQTLVFAVGILPE